MALLISKKRIQELCDTVYFTNISFARNKLVLNYQLFYAEHSRSHVFKKFDVTSLFIKRNHLYLFKLDLVNRGVSVSYKCFVKCVSQKISEN